MATYSQFSNQIMVDSCVPPEKFGQVSSYCSSCWISNCSRSFIYKAELVFWNQYFKQKKITDYVEKFNRTKPLIGLWERRLKHSAGD